MKDFIIIGLFVIFLSLIILLLSLATFSCSQADQRSSNLHKIADNYPLVDGSTSTHPLSVLVACKIRGIPYEWKRPPALERTVFPASDKYPFKASWVEKQIQHHGTHDAYLNLVSGNADLIFVAREPSEREIQTAAKSGIFFDTKPIALDALVFVVHVSNPINNLTLNEIRSIFGPQATRNWKAMGGPDVPIEAFQREQDSGSQELMQKLVMKDLPIRDKSEIPAIYTMAGVVNTVAIHERGIAYSIYYYIKNMAPVKATKMISVDGVPPSSETIATSKYPFSAEVFAVFRKGMKEESPAFMLRQWFESDEGRATILESGYVPLPKSK